MSVDHYKHVFFCFNTTGISHCVRVWIACSVEVDVKRIEPFFDVREGHGTSAMTWLGTLLGCTHRVLTLRVNSNVRCLAQGRSTGHRKHELVLTSTVSIDCLWILLSAHACRRLTHKGNPTTLDSPTISDLHARAVAAKEKRRPLLT